MIDQYFRMLVAQLLRKDKFRLWKKTVEYDVLTINERQNGDQEFFAMLDCIHHGCRQKNSNDSLEASE